MQKHFPDRKACRNFFEQIIFESQLISFRVHLKVVFYAKVHSQLYNLYERLYITSTDGAPTNSFPTYHHQPNYQCSPSISSM